MKRLAVSVLMSALSSGAFASVPQATNTLLADFGAVCESEYQCSMIDIEKLNALLQQSAAVSLALNEQVAHLQKAYFDILDMENPEEAFDVPLGMMDGLEMMVRGLEEMAKKHYAQRQVQFALDPNGKDVIESTRDVLVGIVRLRTALYDLNGLARQCMSDDIWIETNFEPNEDFFIAMHQATNTALEIH